ncbi:MAG: cysteine--tRNA ligase [Clostridium sp.]|nr:cysteine--tRNA ligase [Clostridium sp.]MCM1398088.1 cysteine--tRNA ligase [Clostridium sp.]MCM1459278.1 cysteine--tRNA ligase [Bacteroides sp.]
MKIFNTLTRKKDEFKPINEGKVGIYVCGPTVYDYIHIGNARPMIVFDTLRRYFEYKGYEVNYVSNFTDVDDKIIKKAIEEGIDAREVSEKFIGECKKDMAALNVREASVHPKATEEIDDMIAMVETLIEKEYAYEVNGTVYFRTRKFSDYGKLSKKNLDDLRSGNRELLVSGEDEKEDPLDFVLWKPKKEGEPSWKSPWGDGRPGWHLECSVMSKKYIGDVIDIHAGGEDLIFPHHENEIAQSEAANGTEFARYWMHNGFLKINNEKMSKSLGNFFTVREIGEKYNLQVIRFFMLSAHYRSPLNFSAELVEASKSGLERIKTGARHLEEAAAAGKDGTMTGEEQENAAMIDKLVAKYEEAMEDDLNTADAISVIFELVKHTNTTVKTGETTRAYVEQAYNILCKLTDVLGISIKEEDVLLDDEIEHLIQERQEARKAKNFARADEIRDLLTEKGIILEDTREGVRWKRA